MPDQRLEEPQLALRVHGVDQGLVAVAQVDAGPARGTGEVPVRPGPVGEGERTVGPVEVERHRGDVAGHGQPLGRSAVGVGCRSWCSVRCSWCCSRGAWLLPVVGVCGEPDLGLVRRASGPGQQKTPWPLGLRRLRANAMWRSPSGKEEFRGRAGVHGAIHGARVAPGFVKDRPGPTRSITDEGGPDHGGPAGSEQLRHRSTASDGPVSGDGPVHPADPLDRPERHVAAGRCGHGRGHAPRRSRRGAHRHADGRRRSGRRGRSCPAP